MNFTKVLPLVMVAILLLAARFAVNIPQVDQKAEIEKAERQQAEEKLRRLASTCPVLVTEDDYAVLYPDQPRQDQFILIGSNDDDWHLHWQYDTSFYSERSETDDDKGPTRLEADRALLRDAMQRMIKNRNRDNAGKPEEWIVQTNRNLTHLDTYPVREMTYSYRKYTTELPREGRVWKIKVPGSVVTLQVDGEPEVVNSPLVESFFQSFDYLPRPN
jgi:hypothetical protein